MNCLQSRMTFKTGAKAAVVLLVVFSISCGEETPPRDYNRALLEADTLVMEAPGVADESLERIIQAIPSPIEMSALLLSADAEYSETVLNQTSNYDAYTTSHKQALNLGVFGADLGYLNLYKKTGTSLEYLKTIKQLSEDLKVGQFFDFDHLKELSGSEDNVDSLLTISTRNFSQMNRHLREEKRGKISVLIVTGTFIEGLHMACQTVKSKPIDRVKERIGEQQYSVEALLAILKVYEKDARIAELIAAFEGLKESMTEVKIEIIRKEPVMEEIDGILTLVDQDESVVTIPNETLRKIISATEAIRNKIIS